MDFQPAITGNTGTRCEICPKFVKCKWQVNAGWVNVVVPGNPNYGMVPCNPDWGADRLSKGYGGARSSGVLLCHKNYPSNLV